MFKSHIEKIAAVKIKRTITVEFDRLKITTAPNQVHLLWCELCRTETKFIKTTEAIELVQVLQKQGLEINQQNLHFFQPDETQILVCLHSIINGNNTK